MSVPMTDSPGRNDLYGIHYRHRHMSARGPSKRAMAVVQKFNCGSAIQSYKASIWWAVHIVIELSYTVQTGGEVFSWRHHDSSSTFFCCSRFCGRKRCVLTAAAVPQDTSVYAWELEVPYVLLHFRYESQAAIGCSVLHDGGQHVNRVNAQVCWCQELSTFQKWAGPVAEIENLVSTNRVSKF